ncbi:hypothetical protein ACH4S9_27250 [Streptomyces sp. NPDC021225]|uniref:hypothetical protein n=1 Tax=Streptomyces sp. NPDC021225 TaxID=3365121 RepID=UPI0037A929BD
MNSTDHFDAVLPDFVRCSTGEPEFHQAAREVLQVLAPVPAAYPECVNSRIVKRVCEPKWQVTRR